MTNILIILGGGVNKRLSSKIPKPYIKINNKELIQYSIDAAIKTKKIDKIVIVYNKKHTKFLNNKRYGKYIKVLGGKTRAASVKNALIKINKYKCKNVLIHDAARPNISVNLISKIILDLKKKNSSIPILKINDSIKIRNGSLIKNINRDKLFITQTPQGFKYKDIYKLNKKFFNKDISDDASLYINNQKKINFIKGDENNLKITTKRDLFLFEKIQIKKINYGIGFDIHRLIKKRKLYLGGIKIPSKVGTLGHSDGDPVLHAVIDSILGACKMGDIGEKFSDKNKKFKNIRSTILLSEILKQIKLNNYQINNIDINIITQTPKIKKYKNRIIKCISKLCKILPSQINIKGKTTEKLGLIGKEKAIACEVITSIYKND